MLLWTTLGLAVVGWLLYLIGGKIRKLRYHNRIEDIGGAMTLIFTFVLMLMLAFLGCEYIGTDADLAKNQQHRDFLVAQYKTGIYDGSVLSQYHLLQQIDEWNCTLAEKQKLTHDYWVGIFVPNYWDDLEYITVNLFGDVTGGGDRE